MTEDEKRARIEEIRQKVLAFGEALYLDALNLNRNNKPIQYYDGYNKGYEDGAKNQDEVQYKKGYEQGYKEGFKECVKECEKGYDKGLEDMWKVMDWAFHAALHDETTLFPEYRDTNKRFVDLLREDIGLAEAVRRVKEDLKADAQILYSTISDLKAEYTHEQILKAIKDNGIEVNNK